MPRSADSSTNPVASPLAGSRTPSEGAAVRTEFIVLLVTAISLGCNPSSDPPDAEPEAPAPIGPLLYEDATACAGNDPLCWTTQLHREGNSLQLLHFHGKDGPYLFEQRGELTAASAALIDQAIAEADPSKTDLVDSMGLCGNPDIGSPVFIYVDDLEFEFFPHCPPEGIATLAMLVDEVLQELRNCTAYDRLASVATDCVDKPGATET
jgi:hypothetical protein